MPRYKKGIIPQEVSGARRRGVPESIIDKMVRSQELTQREKLVLNSKGLGYKVWFKKDDGTIVRSHTFALKGGGKGRSGGGSRSENPGRSPIEVKPSLPRGAYS